MQPKTIILTGWSLTDYAYAAAMALRHVGDADIQGMSRRRLPEFLEEIPPYREIILLGISLTGDIPRLKKALETLRKKKIKVIWISALDFPESIGEDVQKLLEAHVIGSDILEAVTLTYHQNYEELSDFWASNTEQGEKYTSLLEAAMFFFRNYQDPNAFSQAIRHLASKDPVSKWTEEEIEMVEHYQSYGNRELLGTSKAIQGLRDSIIRIAAHDRARVLILGESGTGKETVALQLHYLSRRRREPFIVFNCASVNPNLLESRFLGNEKGAFTGAVEMKRGVFEAADGGTLFLDEIGELPLEAQGTLLRVLEGGRFQRMGNNGKEISVNVRVIAATNRDLPRMVRQGEFRADLLQRLGMVLLRMPPLREHLEDIPIIAKAYRRRNGMQGELTQQQIEILQTYNYPGNVRELNNLLERADTLDITDYRQLLLEHQRFYCGMPTSEYNSIPEKLEDAMRFHVKKICKKYGNNLSQAAQKLGITRNTARKYLNQGLDNE